MLAEQPFGTDSPEALPIIHFRANYVGNNMIVKMVILNLALISACGAQTQTNVTIGNSKHNQSSVTATSQEFGMAHELNFTTINGKSLPFSTFAGEVVLVVNTASRCGYTGQYAGLQELYATFKDQGFTVLGVPSNDFGAQEPGAEEQISTFCEMNYGVEFPLTRKTAVTGEDQHRLWQMAKTSLGEKAEPKWNFHKVLIGRDGDFLQAYPSAIRPTDTELVADIERALNTGS